MAGKKKERNFYIDEKGYPRFKDTNEYVHRKVAAKKIGGLIYRGNVVHHKDGNKRNFRRDNLQVMSGSEHSKLHYRERRNSSNESTKSSKGRCFIATAAYGTPCAPEINVLRKWRDEGLTTNKSGQLFVKFYYIISPPVAKFISKSALLKKGVRLILKPFINHLSKE